MIRDVTDRVITFQGNGSNLEGRPVIVVRWVQQRQLDGFIGQVLGALRLEDRRD